MNRFIPNTEHPDYEAAERRVAVFLFELAMAPMTWKDAFESNYKLGGTSDEHAEAKQFWHVRARNLLWEYYSTQQLDIDRMKQQIEMLQNRVRSLQSSDGYGGE